MPHVLYHHFTPYKKACHGATPSSKCFFLILGNNLQMLHILIIRQGKKGISLSLAGIPVGYRICYLYGKTFCVM